MFIEHVFAYMNCYLSQWICMWAYSMYYDWEDGKIDLTRERAAELYNLYDIYAEESEKWYNTCVSISRRRRRSKRQKKFFLEKFDEICTDISTVKETMRSNRKKITHW